MDLMDLRDCEICGAMHPVEFDGDCRDDSNRFFNDNLYKPKAIHPGGFVTKVSCFECKKKFLPDQGYRDHITGVYFCSPQCYYKEN